MYIADLHIHSRYSRATSKDGSPEQLDLWARKKGIQIVGTGDFTHPAWREELKEKLEPAEDGLYTLKKEYRIEDASARTAMQPRFVITGEISSIYKKNGKVRKVHSLILLPGLENAEILSRKLETIGNIHSDGRPILGLDCRDLLEITLEQNLHSIFVPAHIWTPHFSLFGAFSGFDSTEECFGDLTPHIHAMETGLSSDPPMNWRISGLDRYNLISNSDAHSPAKLGREANLFDIELSYSGIEGAIQRGLGLSGTLEFFPEEGKYHYDGHRKCNLCLSPREAEACRGICLVCGKKLTIGVSHRVEQLADREEGYVPEGAKAFESLVPLPEVIGASIGHSSSGRKVQEEYCRMLKTLGAEFDILRKVPLEDIRKVSGRLVAEGIGRLRDKKVDRLPGFDGEYGTIRLFDPSEISNTDGQISFLDCLGMQGGQKEDRQSVSGPGTFCGKGVLDSSVQKNYKADLAEKESAAAAETISKAPPQAFGLNDGQQQAVRSQARVTAVIAGPGTGKTKTLISHLGYLLQGRKVKPSMITAVTFTNKAAAELKERLCREPGCKSAAGRIQTGTFHGICLKMLQDSGMDSILAEEGVQQELAGQVKKEYEWAGSVQDFLLQVSLAKTGENRESCPAIEEYCRRMRELKLMDFDDLLVEALRLAENSEFQSSRFSYLLVDEFQDISPLQYRLIQAWNKFGRELFVIGDPDQSIYGFRGSDARCFDRLQSDFPDMQVIRLTENYRSTGAVLRPALQAISENPGPKRKLTPNKESDIPVRVVKAGSGLAEAIFTAKEINRQVGGMDMLEAHGKYGGQENRKVRGFSDIAVLYRTHRQAELLEKCLQKESIPYIVAGREDYLQEQQVQEALCFFRYLCCGDSAAGKQYLKLAWDLEGNQLSEAVLAEQAERYRPLLKKKPAVILGEWMREKRLENHPAMQKLSGMAVFYKNIAELLDAVRLGVESDLKRCGGKNYSADAVTLMTLHGSKGLEFPVTILYGVNKGELPFEGRKGTADAEEERRLFYVGMTRAKEELILTASVEPSIFLEGLEEAGVVWEEAGRKKNGGESVQLSLFDFMPE